MSQKIGNLTLRTYARAHAHTCTLAHAHAAGIATYTYGFEGDFDGWSTHVTGDLPFLLGSGSTPSGGTGPSSAAAGTGYVYAETSAPNYPNKNFDLEETLPTGQYLYGVAFQYHMYGDTVGTVNLETSADGTSWVSLWAKSGNLGDQWRQATVYAGSGQTMLRYTCVFRGREHN